MNRHFNLVPVIDSDSTWNNGSSCCKIKILRGRTRKGGTLTVERDAPHCVFWNAKLITGFGRMPVPAPEWWRARLTGSPLESRIYTFKLSAARYQLTHALQECSGLSDRVTVFYSMVVGYLHTSHWRLLKIVIKQTKLTFDLKWRCGVSPLPPPTFIQQSQFKVIIYILNLVLSGICVIIFSLWPGGCWYNVHI